MLGAGGLGKIRGLERERVAHCLLVGREQVFQNSGAWHRNWPRLRGQRFYDARWMLGWVHGLWWHKQMCTKLATEFEEPESDHRLHVELLHASFAQLLLCQLLIRHVPAVLHLLLSERELGLEHQPVVFSRRRW